MAQRAHGEGSLYKAADGYWHGSVNLGTGPDGRRLRRHVRGRTQGEVKKKLDQLKRDRDAGEDLAAPREPMVGEWAQTWIEIVERTRRPSTAKTYRTHMKYLAAIQRVRLSDVTPKRFEAIYVRLIDRGVSPISVRGAHRTYRLCFGEADRRGKLDRNPVTAARPGRAAEREVVPLTLEEAWAVLAAAAERRNAAKWAVALGWAACGTTC